MSIISIFIHEMSYKTLISAKLLRVSFDKENEFTKVYDWNYLVLFEGKNYNFIYNRIR